MSFVFYDTETTGRNTAFDQILQFAAIRTDPDLRELDRFAIRCRLLPHIAPSAAAMLITGITAEQLVDRTFPTHYEMVREIYGKLRSWSPAVFVGFNSLRFDEHLLRQAFYQTLHPIYLTNSGGNCRADAIRVVQSVSIFAPSSLNYPTDQLGRKLLRLRDLSQANGFRHISCHDALDDVEATIFLCRTILDRAPDLWSAFVRFSQKASVRDYVLGEPVFCLSEFYRGQPRSWIVSTIGPSTSNSSEFFVFDLATDPNELRGLSESDLAARLNEYSKPVHRVKSNACPIITAAEDAPEFAISKRLGLDELERRAHVLAEDEDLRRRLISTLEQIRGAKESFIHVEQQIYDGFYCVKDDEILQQFHDIPWRERKQLISRLNDPRLHKLAARLLFFERPELLDDETRRAVEQDTTLRLMQDSAPDAWLTLPKAIEEIDELLPIATDKESNCLRGHRALLLRRMQQLGMLYH